MNTNNLIFKVADFHSANSIVNNQSLTEIKDYQLRYNLMKEENDEYLDACEKEDIIEIADALGDQLYILLGTILRHGLQYEIEDVFDEIHRSNMSKLGADGLPVFREDGKIIKGPNYFKPNLIKILTNE